MSKQRNIGLDILRAYAILAVLIIHGFFITGGHSSTNPINYFLFDGVGVFFVLSGFLIGRILIYDFQKYGANLATLIHFWIRRWYRTLPLYIVILAIVSIPFLVENRISLKELIPYGFFANNFFIPPSTRFFGESWSLAVEEWFYLIIPFSFFLVTRLRKNIYSNILILSAVLISFIFLYRYLNLSNASTVKFYHQTVMYRLDSLIFGVLLANFYVFKKTILDKWKNILFGVGLILLIILKTSFFQFIFQENYYVFSHIFMDTYFSIAIACIIPKVLDIKITNPKLVQVITFVSLISYSLYLTHLTLVQKILWNVVVKVIGYSKTQSNYEVFHYIFYWVISFVVSYAFYRFLEVPFMAKRKKYNFERINNFISRNK